ncbi:MAG TPA: DUF4149 domain-containing protein [Gaiellaceae bacterium]|nr:DUF4149 domain-containing protein [Gaiellaceae bacterium]
MSEAVVGTITAPASPHAAGRLIPTGLLVVPGTAVVLLLVAIFSNRLWPLDFLHVAFGGLWTGVDLFMGFLVGPVLRRLDPSVRGAFMRRLMPKMLVLMPTLALTTMTAGWQLGRKVGVLDTAYPRHWWVVASFVIVAVLALTAFAVLLPANIGVLMELRKPQPDGQLIARLMSRYTVCTAIQGCMQIATLIVMTRIATW